MALARLSYQPEVKVLRRRYLVSFESGESAGELRRCLEHVPEAARVIDVVTTDTGGTEMTFEREEEDR